MELLIAFATVIGINAAAIGASTAYFKRLFIAEEKFHVLTDGGQVRVVQGRRRTPLKVSEAETQLAIIKKVARRSGRLWMRSLWDLYGPKNTRKLDTELDVIRRNAVKSQRTKLQIEAMNGGYSETELMGIISLLSKDEDFEKIRTAMSAGVPTQTLAVAAKLELEAKKAEDFDGHEVVLMEIKSVRAPQLKAVTTRKSSGGIPIPDNCEWAIGWENRGVRFEKMVVILKFVGEKGKVIRKEGFYTSVWRTPDEQRGKIRELQKNLAFAARHDMDPSGVAPEIQALL